MKCIEKFVGCALLSFTMSAHAGFWGTTIHSRGNCGNNESITWYANHSYNWQVVSFHNYDYDNPSAGYHYIDTGMSLTWRQAAVHWGESGPLGKYGVTGFHYFLWKGKKVLDNNTYANDCSIYDGWWD